MPSGVKACHILVSRKNEAFAVCASFPSGYCRDGDLNWKVFSVACIASLLRPKYLTAVVLLVDRFSLRDTMFVHTVLLFSPLGI